MGKEEQQITIFRKSGDYNRYFADRGMTAFGPGRAKGIRYKDGHEEILIDREYYHRAGITDDMLEAIVLHEQTELSLDSDDAHQMATVAEYRYIRDNFGR